MNETRKAWVLLCLGKISGAVGVEYGQLDTRFVKKQIETITLLITLSDEEFEKRKEEIRQSV